MIKTVEIVSGFAKKLPALKNPIVFHDGLNIIFGPNGCGKSTLLNIAAAYCFCPTDGWHKILTPSQFPFNKSILFPDDLFKIAPGNCKAVVDWDGSPIYKHSSSDKTFSHTDQFSDSPLGFGGELSMLFNKPSSGQGIIIRLNSIIDTIIKKPKDFIKTHKDDAKNYNDVWKSCYDVQLNYVASLPRNGKLTLIIDEPDKSMSIVNQQFIWEKMLPELAKKVQIIVATHSIFALNYDNIIDMQPGYVNESKMALKSLKLN